ncbi:MAG: hypothetical protein ACTSPB_10120 [Candidatus Thorarchaeota archaeon]
MKLSELSRIKNLIEIVYLLEGIDTFHVAKIDYDSEYIDKDHVYLCSFKTEHGNRIDTYFNERERYYAEYNHEHDLYADIDIDYIFNTLEAITIRLQNESKYTVYKRATDDLSAYIRYMFTFEIDQHVRDMYFDLREYRLFSRPRHDPDPELNDIQEHSITIILSVLQHEKREKQKQAILQNRIKSVIQEQKFEDIKYHAELAVMDSCDCEISQLKTDADLIHIAQDQKYLFSYNDMLTIYHVYLIDSWKIVTYSKTTKTLREWDMEMFALNFVDGSELYGDDEQ